MRPDPSIVILEVKGQNLEQGQAKRRFLDGWVKAVNDHNGSGAWSWEASKNPRDVKDLCARHSQHMTQR
jgi:type III restriction enzyme